MKYLVLIMALFLSGCASTLTDPKTGEQFTWPFFGFSETQGFGEYKGHKANMVANALWSCEEGGYASTLHCVDAALESVTFKPYKAHYEGGGGLVRHRKDMEQYKVDYNACMTYAYNAQTLLDVYGLKGKAIYAYAPDEAHMGWYIDGHVFDINYGLMPLEEFKHVYEDVTFDIVEFYANAEKHGYEW